MFSFMLNGTLGELLAPRPNPKDELMFLVKGGCYDKALNMIRNTDHSLLLVNELDSSGFTVLHAACAAGAMEVVVELLSQGADLNTKSNSGSSALHYACMNNRKGIVEILLRYGADPSVPNIAGVIAWELTSRPDIQDLLVREEFRSKQKDTKSAAVFEQNHLAAVDGVEANFVSMSLHDRLTPAATFASSVVPSSHIASFHIGDGLVSGNIPGMTMNFGDETGPGAAAPLPATQPYMTQVGNGPYDDSVYLSAAVLEAAIETANSLKTSGSDFEVRRDLFRFCRETNSLPRLRRLLDRNEALVGMRAVELLNVAADGSTPLHCAAQHGNSEVLKEILRRTDPRTGKPVSAWCVDLLGRTPLHLAAEWGKHEAAALLRAAMETERHVDPVGARAPPDLSGTTPLGWAAKRTRGRPSVDMLALFSPGDASVLPRTPHTLRTAKTAGVTYAYSAATGWRGAMEDQVVTCTLAEHSSLSLLGVLDGHGGAYAAQFLASALPETFRVEASVFLGQTLTGSALESVLRRTVLAVDAALRQQPRMHVSVLENGNFTTLDCSGSTAVLAAVSRSLVAVANVGDSRAVLARRGNMGDGLQAVALSIDHKLSIPEERLRAETAGGIVEAVEDATVPNVWQVYTARYGSKLRMSRSLGDFYLKMQSDKSPELQIVSPDPDVTIHTRDSDDAFLLLASDGVFDVMTNQQAVDFVAGKLAQQRAPGVTSEESLASVCDALLEECLGLGSADNMTALLILLNDKIVLASDREATPLPQPDCGALSPAPSSAESDDTPIPPLADTPIYPKAEAIDASPIRATRLFTG